VTNYEAIWRVLADLITELRRAGEVVPSHVMKDLRSAKTTMQILKVDRNNLDHISRIEEFLGNVTSYAMYAAQRTLGAQAFDSWVDRLEEARRHVPEETQPTSGFIPGVPRDKYWIRMKATEDIPLYKIKGIAAESGLEHKIHENQYIIVYGEKGRIQDFIKRIMGRCQD